MVGSSRAGGWLTRLLAENSPSEVFVFLGGRNQFELYANPRVDWDQRYEVGWKPITERSGLRF